MANESTTAEAQSLPEAAPAGELTFTPESQQAPLSVPLAEQFGSLSPDQLQAVIDKLGGDTDRRIDGPGAPVQPLREPAAAAEATPTAPETVAEVPAAEVPAEVPPAPPVEPQENAPGRIRIDRITDERTRKILEFQSRNHDATIEDAIAFVDGQQASAAPAPQAQTPVADPAGIQARIADLNRQIKAGLDPMSPGHDPAMLEDLREQRENLRVDLRFAQEQANRQQASIQDQRVGERQASADSALAMCPEINDVNSPQGREFTRIVDMYKTKNDPILHNDNLPMLVALQVMHSTGYTAKRSAAVPPTTPAASVPARPVAPVVRTTVPVNGATPPAPVTAPGNARLTPASAPTMAQLEAALSSADDATLDLIIAKTGEKLAPKTMPYSRA